MKKRSNSDNTGMVSGMMKKSLTHTMLKNCEKPSEDVEDAVGPVMMCEGGALSPSPIEGEASVGKFSRTYQRRPKLKGLMELGVPNSHPRRSARLHAKIPQTGSFILFKQGMSSASLSDGDIENCNQRLFVSDPVVEPSKLWEISNRRLGIRCRGDQQEVVKEYSCMETRDLEFMGIVEEGKKDGSL